jgi:hypothetical protein
MPVAAVRAVDINYEMLGERGPWVALQPGGRRGLAGVKSLGQKIAEAGCRVLVYDRRNCGASAVSFGGGSSENEIWAEDLRALLAQLDALPACVGGSQRTQLGRAQPNDRMMGPLVEGAAPFFHKVLTEDRPDLDTAMKDWEAKEGVLAAIFIDFLRRTERRGAA